MFDYGFERCVSAVSITLPSRTVREPAALMVPWTNHHSRHTVTELRSANLLSRKLKTLYKRRLFSCLFDIGLAPELLATAQQAPPPPGPPPSVIDLESVVPSDGPGVWYSPGGLKHYSHN